MSRSISFDKDLADKIGINAAIVYNELSFWNGRGKREDGWVYKTYREMTERLPLSQSTIQRAYKALEAQGFLETKVMKVGETPMLHYKLTKSDIVKLTISREPVKLTKSSTIKNSNKPVWEQTSAEILALLNRITGRTFRVLPRGAKKVAATFSLAEIEAALINMAADDWHHERLGELSSDYMLRATTIDKFLDIKAADNRSTAL